MEAQLRQEVHELLELGEQADQGALRLPEGLVVEDEVAIRKEWLENLAEAKSVLEARAQERYEAEKAEVVVDQESLLIVPSALSNHPNDKQEAEPALYAISLQVGTPKAAALDNGYFSEDNIAALEERRIEPYIATGREAHHKSWCSFFDERPEPPSEEASPKVKMAYKLQTEIGQAIYRLRKCTVEPVIGIIKEILGFRQFSLRGLMAAAGERCLVFLAFNFKRMHTLMVG